MSSSRNVTTVGVLVETVIKANSYHLVKLPSPTLDVKNYCVVQFQTLSAFVYICETLLDMDRVDNSIYIYNSGDQDYKIFEIINVQLFVYYEHSTTAPLYSCEVFYQPKEFTGDKLRCLQKTTYGANGLDISFERKNYILPANGHIKIVLPFSSSELYNRPNTVLLRSRYAKIGVLILRSTKHTFLLINNSPNEIYLGGRFIQFLPEPYYAFNMDKVIDKRADHPPNADGFHPTNMGFIVEDGNATRIGCYCKEKKRTCKQ